MVVLQQLDDEGCRLDLTPNCALSWRWTKRLFLGFFCCLAGVAAYFVSLGAWLVLPFAGLELVVLGAGFYLSALAGHTSEIIELGGSELRVLRGRRRRVEMARMPRYWTRVVISRDPRGWYPSRLVLRCHGRRIAVGAMLVEAEREQLAAQLAQELGRPLRGHRLETAGPLAATPEPGVLGHPGTLLEAEVHARPGLTPSEAEAGRRRKTRCAAGAQ